MQQYTNSKSPSGTISGGSGKDFQQLWGKWNTLLNGLYDDPRVARVVKSGVGQYLSSHPFLALTVMLFATMAAVPVGLFLSFALVTVTLSAVGFVFCEVALLFVAGVSLLSVLSGLALFSVFVSFVVSAFYFMFFNISKYYSPTKQGKVQEESEAETSRLEDVQ